MLGRDPNAEVPQDMARAIVDHINERVETLHQAWDWPEWQLTEERAFRQVWNDTHQYKVASDTDGLPDEVFYLGDSFVVGGEFGDNYGYYRVLLDAPSDPPVGTLPTDETYWEAISPVDAYVAYDQVCKRSIGRVIGVYSGNPRRNGQCGLLCFKPSEKGIDVRGNSLPTVFLTYLMPLPVYTIVPYVIGPTYQRGDVAFDPSRGECFQAIVATTSAPSPTGDWRWVPFLDKWATYVVQGAFSDCLGEFDQGGNDDIQAKQALAAVASNKADRALESRIDDLTSQGQVVKYSFCRNKCHCWCESIPFSGGVVTTLTEACDEGGFVYPTPAPTFDPCDTTFHSEIVALLTADGTPSLEGLNTTSRAITCTQITITIIVDDSPEVQVWQLQAGPADVDDAGQIAPADYNLATNNKKWVKVG